MRLSAHVLVHRQQTGHSRPPREHLAHPVTRSLGRHHRHIDAVRRHYRLEVDVETVREHQRLARQKVREYRLPVHLGLDVVRNQHHNDVRLLGSLFDQSHLQPVRLRLLNAPAALVKANHHVQAGVLEVQRVGMALAAVADDPYRAVLDQRHIRVVLVVHRCHVILSLFPGGVLVTDRFPFLCAEPRRRGSACRPFRGSWRPCRCA